eukprot:596232_1
MSAEMTEKHEESPPDEDHKVQHSQRISTLVSTQVLEGWYSDRRAKQFSIIRMIFIGIIMTGLLCWQLYRYSDPKWNSATSTEIQINVDHIDVPYLYFSTLPGSDISDVSIKAIRFLRNDIRDQIDYNWNVTDKFSIEYANQWTVIDISDNNYTDDYHLGDLLIMPPKQIKLKRAHGMMVVLEIKSNIELTKPINVGIKQGLFWSVGNADDILLHPNDFEGAINQKFASHKLQLQYSSVATLSFCWLNVVDSVDKFYWNRQDTDTYYTPQKISEVFDIDYINSSYNSTSNETVYTYTNSFYFLTVAGYFGPLAAFTSILVTLFIFGMPPVFEGFAIEKGLSKREKRQIALYLLELGVIDDKKLDLMTKQYDKLGQQQKAKLSTINE